MPEADCRKCGACCVAISISSPVPGMPHGKPAGVPCGHLTTDNLCGLFGMRERPDVCSMFQPSADVCGSTREEALKLIAAMEAATRPDDQASTSRSTPASALNLTGENELTSSF